TPVPLLPEDTSRAQAGGKHGMTDLSIIVVSWNSRPYLEACLSSLSEGAGPIAYEAFVVDNGSTDGSAAFVRERFPQVQLIANPENRGFAAANNQALRLAAGRYAILLNPDTRVHPHALEKLVRFMDDRPDAGACGPLLLNEDGSPQHAARRFPTFGYALGARTIMGRLGFFRKSYDAGRMRGVIFRETTEVDQPSGAALLLRRSVLEQVGLLDERFFIFYEEVDLCRRIRDAGRRIYLFPGATITHYGGRSRRQNRVRIIGVNAESMLKYFRIHEPPLTSALFELAFRPLFALGICADAASAALKSAGCRLRPSRWSRAAQRDEVTRSYATFITRDMLKFLLSLWE
ncbi:MAG: glycosyltransferase family 2 protein, partial [Candidatus Aureabacteria bacterium]|nr:glycosyltransferase family 2 protein [Candidatus Auribacterota bacterium]